jgi:hypothetical protein
MGSIAVKMESCGPIVEVTVMAKPFRAAILRAQDQPVPAPATMRALIDTGASASVLDATITPARKSSSLPLHEPDAPARDPRHSPRWRVGFVWDLLPCRGHIILRLGLRRFSVGWRAGLKAEVSRGSGFRT